MHSEIIRDFVFATIGTGLVILLGFLPLAFHDDPAWAASRVSNIGMPIGQSAPPNVMSPLRLNEPRFSTPKELLNQ